jgi:magnesium-transporting ATPase (P-type)
MISSSIHVSLEIFFLASSIILLDIITARNIAKKCGILRKGGIIMEGPDFRRLSKERMLRFLPNLQVLARSSPLDKQILVQQ